MPEPLSTTKAATSSSHILNYVYVWNPTGKRLVRAYNLFALCCLKRVVDVAVTPAYIAQCASFPRNRAAIDEAYPYMESADLLIWSRQSEVRPWSAGSTTHPNIIFEAYGTTKIMPPASCRAKTPYDWDFKAFKNSSCVKGRFFKMAVTTPWGIASFSVT